MEVWEVFTVGVSGLRELVPNGSGGEWIHLIGMKRQVINGLSLMRGGVSSMLMAVRASNISFILGE